MKNFDIVILGGGMVGLSLAYQIQKRFKDLTICLIEKEKDFGLHTSGRNSGVIHSGIYYPPNTLKASVCLSGAKRLKDWIKDESLPILNCGKVISPQKPELDKQLDLLIKRAKINGVRAEIIDKDIFKKLVPDGRTSTGRAIWCPDTSVVKPKEIIKRISERIKEQGAEFIFDASIFKASPKKKSIEINRNNNKETINFEHLFNTSGLYSDQVAKLFGVSRDLTILPFKGVYYELKKNTPLNFKTNLYPVPDLNMPFLGIHVTPSPDRTISFGPTAFPAFGRENYEGVNGFEPLLTTKFMMELSIQFFKNENGFRKYVYEQSLHGFKPFFLSAAKNLIPKLKSQYLQKSKKVGIRPQLYNKNTRMLIQDFYIENGVNSTHVLNAISPAFTASFSLADLIINSSNAFKRN